MGQPLLYHSGVCHGAVVLMSLSKPANGLIETIKRIHDLCGVWGANQSSPKGKCCMKEEDDIKSNHDSTTRDVEPTKVAQKGYKVSVVGRRRMI